MTAWGFSSLNEILRREINIPSSEVMSPDHPSVQKLLQTTQNLTRL